MYKIGALISEIVCPLYAVEEVVPQPVYDDKQSR